MRPYLSVRQRASIILGKLDKRVSRWFKGHSSYDPCKNRDLSEIINKYDIASGLMARDVLPYADDLGAPRLAKEILGLKSMMRRHLKRLATP